jgi:putative transcriptional regulator
MDKIEFQQKLGEHIKQIRKNKGVTCTELASRCLMDKPNIHKLENGDFNPSAYYLARICKGLEISLQELFSGFNY